MKKIKIISKGRGAKVLFDDFDVSGYLTGLTINMEGGHCPEINARAVCGVEIDMLQEESEKVDLTLNYTNVSE